MLNNALAFRQIADLSDRFRREKQYLEEEINLEHRFEEVIGESPSLRQVIKDIETVAPTDEAMITLSHEPLCYMNKLTGGGHI